MGRVIQGPRHCHFCGITIVDGQNHSDEHVFARWLQRHFGLKRRMISFVRETMWGPRETRKMTRLQWYVMTQVCRNCNNEWMSTLENQNATRLKTLAAGKGDLISLDDVAAFKLARWACKTAFAHHAASDHTRLVPPEQFRALAEPDGFPERVVVVGQLINQRSNFSVFQSSSWSLVIDDSVRPARTPRVMIFGGPTTTRGYKLCIGINHLLLAVASAPHPKDLILLNPCEHVPIWPRESRFKFQKDRGLHFEFDEPDGNIVSFSMGVACAIG